jgi:hypothetical protein
MERAFQALALFVSANFARDADVFDSRHVDNVAARQGDVRSDARAFLADGFFGDLNDDLLAFAQEVGDDGALVAALLAAAVATTRWAAWSGRRRGRGYVSGRGGFLFRLFVFFRLGGCFGGVRAALRREITAAAPTATARRHLATARALAHLRRGVFQRLFSRLLI